MKRNIRVLAEAVLPAAMYRRFFVEMHARHLRKNYFGSRSRSVPPAIMASGETHNFTHDLTDKNLRH